MKNKLGKIHLVQSKQDCNHCDIHQFCIALGLDDKDTGKLNDIVKQNSPYDTGSYIFKRGDKFKSLFVLQRGVVKSETSTIHGTHNVTGFYFPGDLIGIDAIAEKEQHCDLIAIQQSWLCEIPFVELEKLCTTFPDLQRELFQRFSKRIFHNEYNCMKNRGESSENRLLSFLVELMDKLKGTKYIHNNQLQLPMTKVDLASYLGLRPETLSRTLKQLQASGYIVNTPTHIEFVDKKGMSEIDKNNRV